MSYSDHQYPSHQNGPPLSPFLRSINALALVFSGITALLLAPYLAGMTENIITSLVSGGYGAEWSEAARVAWRIFVIPLLFFMFWLVWQAVFMGVIVKASMRFFR